MYLVGYPDSFYVRTSPYRAFWSYSGQINLERRNLSITLLVMIGLLLSRTAQCVVLSGLLSVLVYQVLITEVFTISISSSTHVESTQTGSRIRTERGLS